MGDGSDHLNVDLHGMMGALVLVVMGLVLVTGGRKSGASRGGGPAAIATTTQKITS